MALEDAQRTVGLVRFHASEYRIDPHKIGVLGFSAGGYLAAEISTKYQKRLYAPIDDADKESVRPDFAMLIYPGHLATGENGLNPNVPVTTETPPAFLVQAENDDVDGVNQVLVYNAALQKAGVKVGDTLEISRQVRVVKDPTTGKVIKAVTDKIGQATVTDVDDDSSTATFSGGGAAKVGDVAKNNP